MKLFILNEIIYNLSIAWITIYQQDKNISYQPFKTHICFWDQRQHVWLGWHFKNEVTMAVQCDSINSTWPSAPQHHTPPSPTLWMPKTYSSDVNTRTYCTDL